MERDDRINILPPEVSQKIAAGEVVDRPASIVKELLENSLDAGARRIQIEIERAGKDLIRVRDDGTGIHPEDIEKVFLRHATSKIKDSDDLTHILTLGFRGEALYSISAVSHLRLRSLRRGFEGWEVEVKGGEILSKRPTAMNPGTEVIVRQLFFNTPARRKFLKSESTELRNIVRTVTPYLLTHPDVEITLSHNRNTLIDRLPPGDIPERAERLFGIPKDQLLFGSAELKDPHISLIYLLGSNQVRLPRRNAQFTFVNRRPVYHAGLSSAINQTYKTIMPPNSYPAFFLWIEIDPHLVDVNIHPTKREIRFQKENLVVSKIASFLQHKLTSFLGRGAIAVLTTHERRVDSQRQAPPQKTYQPKAEYHFSRPDLPSPVVRDRSPDYQSGETKTANLREELARARPVGVTLNKYGILEGEESLILIDMHAAQERINYERLLKAGPSQTQQLLSPIIVSLSKEEELALQDLLPALEEFGFEIRPWKDGAIAIHAHPALIKDPVAAIKEILFGDVPLLKTEQMREIMARKACRMSLMAGDKMGIEELKRLKADLLACDNPLACPHGRPTMIRLTDAQLERLFRRR